MPTRVASTHVADIPSVLPSTSDHRPWRGEATNPPRIPDVGSTSVASHRSGTAPRTWPAVTRLNGVGEGVTSSSWRGEVVGDAGAHADTTTMTPIPRRLLR